MKRLYKDETLETTFTADAQLEVGSIVFFSYHVGGYAIRRVKRLRTCGELSIASFEDCEFLDDFKNIKPIAAVEIYRRIGWEDIHLQ